MHGIGIEELIYKKNLKENSALHNQLNKMEGNIIKKADAIFCVSEEMKAYITSKYDANTSKVVVTPTNVDTDVFSYSEERRQQAIQKLSLGDKFVVLFMGHMNKWQVNGSFAILFRIFKEKIGNVHFLILSDGKKVFVDIFKKIGISENDYSIYSVKHEEVPNYALAGDVGVLLRDGSIVNKVAAPAKFGEYLALGIPVIVTKGVGDTEEIVGKYRLGSIIDDTNPNSSSVGVDELLNLVRDDGWKLSERCNRIANDLLSVKVSIQKFLLTYDKLLSR
jgi:glycosyltransferase involved in cell wall biosynthesis